MMGQPTRGGKPERSKPNWAALRRAMGYNRHYSKIMLIAYGTLMIATLAQLAVPTLVRRLIDAVTNGVIAQNVLQVPAQFQPLALQKLGLTAEQVQANATNAQSNIIGAALIIIGFAAVRGVFAFLQSYNAEKLSQSVAFDIRNDIFSKIQRLSFSYHDKNQTGQLMVRATDDVEKVRLFIGQGLLLALQSVVLLVGTLIIISISNWQLTLAILPILPIAMILFMVFSTIAQPLFMQVQIRLSKLNTLLQENLAGIKVVKAFAREPSEQKKFVKSADDLMGQQLKVLRVMTFLMPTIFLIANLGQAIVLYAGGTQIINGTMTLGQYQEFSLYLMFVFMPIGQLGFIITQMAQASASAGRVFEIMDAKSDVTDKPDATALPVIRGTVEFKDVSFKYPGGAQVLNQMNFVAQPGQTVALLGATGSGKSSIINLIPRFYDPTSGVITIDGYDLRDVTIDSMREADRRRRHDGLDAQRRAPQEHPHLLEQGDGGRRGPRRLLRHLLDPGLRPPLSRWRSPRRARPRESMQRGRSTSPADRQRCGAGAGEARPWRYSAAPSGPPP